MQNDHKNPMTNAAAMIKLNSDGYAAIGYPKQLNEKTNR